MNPRTGPRRSSPASSTPRRSSAASQGDFQPLPGGDWQVGWGQEPYFSEFAPGGQLLFDAHLPPSYQSYTVFKFPWTGTPSSAPQIAVHRHGRSGQIVYASWNGATAVAQWRVLAGASASALAPVAAAPRSAFETAIALAGASPLVAAQALGTQGQVLGTSAVTRAPTAG